MSARGARGSGARDDWYRATRWSAEHAEAFEARLARARPENRAQYLRIQAVCLSDAGGRRERRVARELYERAQALATERGDQMELASIYAGLAELDRDEGDPVGEAANWRRTLDAEAAFQGRVSHGAELRLARLIAEERWVDRYDEADALLDIAVDDGLLFRDAQFVYAQARMRLAQRRGQDDLAAAYGMGALALLADNRPMAPRHPTIGLIRRSSADEREIKRVVRAGTAEFASPVIDAFRDADGSVDWGWELVARLHRRPDERASPEAEAWAQ